ncbi:MAG: hypothetical protein GWM92_15770 [Gemmatimonadetes bacterium]|nr:hypothetical protein [Gemmatimonadota bacterium]NIR80190.1 hypothetical protein [Gemmatimonadota bacterium]NIT88952.1 hypothetical protein [Gemmatimonadota bacterium]NIU32747.1 hypothetical protein [Gemmatimonadota bacterium]NIU37179.1 hypothetical protein [Gemmatimonadota bacterium]
MWVYRRTEPGVYTVGFYAPDGSWHSESDHDRSDLAAVRTAWLNGSGPGRAPGPDAPGLDVLDLDGTAELADRIAGELDTFLELPEAEVLPSPSSARETVSGLRSLSRFLREQGRGNGAD